MDSDDLRHKANGTRLSRLLVDKGTEAMRQIFDWLHPPSRLAADLRAQKRKLYGLRYEIINRSQWDLLYPKGGNPDSKTFDITLLTILFRNICGLSAPATGWNTLPPDADRSLAAKIVRIKQFRNYLYSHITTTGVNDAEFEDLWQKISSALTDLEIPQSEIGDLKSGPLTPEEEIYVQQLKEWKLADEKYLKILGEISENVETIGRKVEKMDRNVRKIVKIGRNKKKKKRKRKPGDECTEEVRDKRIARETQQPSPCPNTSVASLTHESYDKLNSSEDSLLNLASYNFKGEIKSKSKSFLQGTREWLFKKLDDWFADKESRVIILTASPGVGKSVFAGKVCQVYEEQGKLAACHFCKFIDSDLSNPRRMLESLARHMCDRVEGFKMKLIEQLRQPHEVRCLEDAFRLYLNQPLQNLERSSPMLIVIDGLDESAAYGKSELLDLIAEEFSKLPEWVKILVTSRPETPVKKKLSNLNPVEILPGDKENDADVQQYLECCLSSLSLQRQAISSLVKRCEGSFLFAYHVQSILVNRKNVSQLDLRMETVNLLPQGIGSIYEKYFDRLVKELKALNEHLDVFPLLEILVSAKGPLPLKFISEVFELPSMDSRLLTEILRKANECLSSLLFVSDDCVTVFHKSLVDWLTSDGYNEHRYTVERKDGNEKLWQLCRKEFENMKGDSGRDDLKMTAAVKYSLRYGRHHLVAVDEKKRCDSDYEWLVDVVIVHFSLSLDMPGTFLEDCDWAKVLGGRSSRKNCIKIFWHYKHLKFDGQKYLQDVVNESCGIFNDEEKRFAKVLLKNYTWCERLRATGWQDRHLVSAVNIFSSRIICVGISRPVFREKQLFAAGFEDGSLVVLDQEICTVGKFQTNDKERVSCCVFSPDKKLLLYGHLNSCFVVDTGQQSSFFPDCNEKYTACSFSPSGKRLLTSDRSEVIKLWDVTRQRLLRVLTASHPVQSCQYSESGRFIISIWRLCFPLPKSDRITIWSSITLQRVDQRLDSRNLYSRKTPSGHDIEGINKCFDIRGTEQVLSKYRYLDIYLLPMTFPVAHLLKSPSSKPVYFSLQTTDSCSALECCESSWNKTDILWGSYTAGHLLSSFDHTVLGSILSVDDRVFVVSVEEALFCDWNCLVLMKLPCQAPITRNQPVCCSFSPDGSRLASCCSDGMVKIWNVSNCQVIHSFQWRKTSGCYWSESYFWTFQVEEGEAVISRLPVEHLLIKFGAGYHIRVNAKVEELLTFSEGVFVLKCEDGFASFFSVSDDNCSPTKKLSCANPVLCAAISPGGHRILTVNTEKYQIWALNGDCLSDDSLDSLVDDEIESDELNCCISSDGEKGVIKLSTWHDCHNCESCVHCDSCDDMHFCGDCYDCVHCIGSLRNVQAEVVDMHSGDLVMSSSYISDIDSICCVGKLLIGIQKVHQKVLTILDLEEGEEIVEWRWSASWEPKNLSSILAYSRQHSILVIPGNGGEIEFVRIHIPEQKRLLLQ